MAQTFRYTMMQIIWKDVSVGCMVNFTIQENTEMLNERPIGAEGQLVAMRTMVHSLGVIILEISLKITFIGILNMSETLPN